MRHNKFFTLGKEQDGRPIEFVAFAIGVSLIVILSAWLLGACAGIIASAPIYKSNVRPPTPTPLATPMPTPTTLLLPLIAAPAVEEKVSGIQIWASEVSDPFQDVLNEMSYIQLLLESSDRTSAAWMDTLHRKVVAAQNAHLRIVAIAPPQEAAELHRQVSTATGNCSDAVVYLWNGLNVRSIELLQLSTDTMLVCSTQLDAIHDNDELLGLLTNSKE